MSNLALTGLAGPSNIVQVTPGTNFAAPGTVVQTRTVRTDVRAAYSSLNSGNGTTISDLSIEITPKFETSLLVMTWMINGEMPWDNVFVIQTDTSLITTPGYEGYNNQAGNFRWSGIAAGQYDNDNGSTMSNWYIQYAIPARFTSIQNYAPAVRSSSATSYTFYLNRTIGSAGADIYENAVSTGTIMEIAQ